VSVSGAPAIIDSCAPRLASVPPPGCARWPRPAAPARPTPARARLDRSADGPRRARMNELGTPSHVPRPPGCAPSESANRCAHSPRESGGPETTASTLTIFWNAPSASKPCVPLRRARDRVGFFPRWKTPPDDPGGLAVSVIARTRRLRRPCLRPSQGARAEVAAAPPSPRGLQPAAAWALLGVNSWSWARGAALH